MDHGAEGLERTLDACREYGFLTVGAGRDVEAAAQPLIWSNGNLRIGIVAMAEHEFSIATPNDWGANPLDLRRFVRTVAKHRNKWDYLLVLVHGGVENYPYPTPELRDTCRFLVEQGANAVVCQHTHCPGCWEEYLGGYIVYGQGNLLFEKKGTTEGPWTEGFLITLDVPAVGAGSSLSLHPYRQSATEAGIQLLHDGEAGRALELVSMRSARLGDDLFVVEEFRRYVQANVDRYLALLYRRGPWWRRFHHRIRGWRTPRNPKRDLALLNILRAESLREAGATALDFAVKD
jgi:poly-gamma-glutamate synthesis protein (capsule biosynthesis protein)